MTGMATLTRDLADRFGARLLSAPAACAAYAQSEGPHRFNPPALVARPVDAAEVCLLMQAASAAAVPVVAYGAGTSLEGNAAAARPDMLCIDFSGMSRIVDIRAADMLAVVEPGVTREQLGRELRATGLFFPVDPGADASIGGMISTRASGTTTVRYGSMRDNVLALKVVTAAGELLATGSHARKSASGYDLTHLFTGAEGTLGLIVEASVRLHGQPEATVAAVCDFADVGGAVDTVIATIQSGIAIARMELLDDAAIRACNAQSGLGLPERPTLFLEFHGSAGAVAEDCAVVAELSAACGGANFRTATAAEERSALWTARHRALWAAKAMIPGAAAWVTDICVPISALGEAVTQAKAAIAASGLFAPIVGHVGDGNFHVLFILPPDDPASWDQARAINEAMIAHALSVGGTCTGEHGIGVGKRAAMLREHGGASIAAMRAIKMALDPMGLLNPGKIFLD